MIRRPTDGVMTMTKSRIILPPGTSQERAIVRLIAIRLSTVASVHSTAQADFPKELIRAACQPSNAGMSPCTFSTTFW